MKRTATARADGRQTQVRAAPTLVRMPGPPAGSRAFLANAAHEMLTATYWFEPPPDAADGPMLIRFFGHRKGAGAKTRPGDQFVQDESVDGVQTGNGPVSVTTRVRGINPGEWSVSAKVLPADPSGRSFRGRSNHAAPTLYPGGWSWRSWSFRKVDGSPPPIRTCYEPFAPVPGVVPLVWAALAGVGIVVALAVQRVLLAGAGQPATEALTISLIAIGAGLVGSKLKFFIDHRAEGRVEGWAVQGFLTATAVAGTAALALAVVPLGPFVDATTPGLFFGLAVGRVGCFFAGCCGGQPTGSRWGLWSSDQRVGMRRLPTQLLESALALGVGLGALSVVLQGGPLRGGIFIAALATYTLVRQGIMRLRAERPPSVGGGVLTATAAAIVLIADVVYLAMSSP